ncbi:MAG: sensor histidine kinase [Pseudomonadota bacterium]
MRLRHIFFLIFGVMTALPLAFFWFWLERSMINKEIADVSERHLVIARNLGAALERYKKDVTSSFLLISRNLANGQEMHKVDRILNDLNFTRISIVDLKTNRVLQQADNLKHHPATKFRAEKLDWLAGIAREGEARFSTVHPGATGEPVMFVVKIINSNLAIGELRTSYIKSLGKSVSFGEKGHAAIVDHEGNVLAHPLPSWIAARKNIAKVSAVQRMLNGEQGVETFWSPALKGDMIAGFTAINGAGWGVMIPQPMVELQHRAQVARDSLFYIVAALLAAAALFAAALAPLIASPLHRTISAAKRLRAGELSARIEEDSNSLVPHELKELQETFNAMATAVEMYHRQEEQKRRKAERDAKIKSDYMANLTHELRTPLNAVIGFSDIMCKEQLGPLGQESYQQFVSDINSSASQLLRLVNNLLEFSRIESGAYTLDEEHLSIAHCLLRTKKTLEDQARTRKCSLLFEYPEQEMTLWVDKVSLERMLLGLVSNAMRQTPEGGTVSIVTRVPEHGNPEIRVSDNGPGMSAEQIERAMQPLLPTVNADLAERKGAGLGLALIAKLAERHDGQLVLQSEPGQGTIARLVFPRERLGRKCEVAA